MNRIQTAKDGEVERARSLDSDRDKLFVLRKSLKNLAQLRSEDVQEL